MRRFELAMPESVEECLRVLADNGPDAMVVAGGTDLMPAMKNLALKPAWVVDLSGLVELKVLETDADGALRLGGAVSARTVELAPAVRAGFPMLAESAALLGSVQIRNLATLGGNICNATPSADTAPPLVALDAVAVVAGPNGRRRIPLAEFFVGVRRTVLDPGELLVELVIPAQGQQSGGHYLRHTPRRELDIAVVGVASQLSFQDGACSKARIALGAVAPVPLRATAAEASLVGQEVTPEAIERAAELAAETARPISDQRGSADYRRHLVRVLTRRTLTTALERALPANRRNGAH